MWAMLVAGAAMAGELPGGLILPSASPMEAGTGYAGVASGGVVGRKVAPYGSVQAGYAVTDELGISAAGFGYTYDRPGGGGLVGLRYAVAPGERLQVAPWVLGGVLGEGTHRESLVAGGVAIQVGAPERIRFDASVPFAALRLAEDDVELFPAYVLPELGVTFPLAEALDLRVGAEAVLPTAELRYAPERFYAAAGVGVSPAGIGSAGWVRGGVRF